MSNFTCTVLFPKQTHEIRKTNITSNNLQTIIIIEQPVNITITTVLKYEQKVPIDISVLSIETKIRNHWIPRVYLQGADFWTTVLYHWTQSSISLDNEMPSTGQGPNNNICSLPLWRVARGSKHMRLELIHGLFIT